MAANELLFLSGVHPAITGGQILTVGKAINSFDAHLCQVARHCDGLVWGCFVLVQVLLATFEECWPFAAKCLPELPQNLHVALCVDHLGMGDPIDV